MDIFFSCSKPDINCLFFGVCWDRNGTRDRVCVWFRTETTLRTECVLCPERLKCPNFVILRFKRGTKSV